jgi:hypothetical protein
MGNKKIAKKRNKRKLRSQDALAAILRTSAGPMKDKRKKRLGTKNDQNKAAVRDGW